ncbi:ABC transporter ATP-binding protein [Piscinibacter koreensis]|uniref:ABC transporter ATP-binding protein n=1 Tax=Piscinibacter koreensis TaxID=2742824 RepID=A0A7Y6NL21_9BURK|nr:ABC transporter ATP-binding protein [Schlegelella koreensis]NUZ05161.1 ABC transporter ATP-binding protein [Schlegelella koreensis]
MKVIEVDHVTKEFRLGQTTTLRNNLRNLLSSIGVGPRAPRRQPFRALDDVHFAVEQGEVLGIIGTNGAGKSTLLKILAGITAPTRGRVAVRGRIAPLIEVGAGLIADLTGRENIYLNAALLGMSYRDIRRKIDEIIDFAELAEFMDTPLKRYSSGMAVRLGFSIATSVDADVLIVDEVLAVGDMAFQRKCFDRMEDLIKRQGKTVLMVSHNLRQVERLCSRVILLDHGRVLTDDEPNTACELFYKRSDEKIKQTVSRTASASALGNALVSEDIDVLAIDLVDAAGNSADSVVYKHDFSLRVRYRVNKAINRPVFGVGVHTTDLLYITTHNSDYEVTLDRLEPGEYESNCRVACCPLIPGVYAIRVGISDGSSTRLLFYGENLVHFQVLDSPASPILHADRAGFFELDARWQDPLPLPAAVEQAPPAPVLAGTREAPAIS